MGDAVSKENMILTVNEKKLSKKYIDLKKQQSHLFNEYRKLLKYLMEIEQFLFDKVIAAQVKNEHFRIFTTSILETVANKMVPLNEYKNIEIECKSLYETRSYLLNIINQFQSYSLKYFKCKRNNITLENELSDIQYTNTSKNDEANDGNEEIVYNAELEMDENVKLSIKTTEREYAKTKKKYENAMCHIKEIETDSSMLHSQINELRSICMDQTSTISKLEKKLNSDHCNLSKFNELESNYQVLTVEYNKKCVQINQLKQKTDFAVSSLQTLQTKIMSVFDSDADDNLEQNKIENILKNTQNIHNKLAMSEQTIKSLKDRVCSLEVEMLRDCQKFNDLQSKYLNIEKSKRFLEANFNCIYSKILHKTSNKYLAEIDDLRNENEELLEYLSEEQQKTKEIYDAMFNHKAIIESFKVKVENLNDLNKQYELVTNDENESSNKYLKNWQAKCTNLEIKEIELL